MAASSIRTASSRASSEVDDIAAFSFGGIPSDDETIKENHAGTRKDYGKYKVCFYDIHGVSLVLLLGNIPAVSRQDRRCSFCTIEAYRPRKSTYQC